MVDGDGGLSAAFKSSAELYPEANNNVDLSDVTEQSEETPLASNFDEIPENWDWGETDLED
jgi:hypothetical protein